MLTHLPKRATTLFLVVLFLFFLTSLRHPQSTSAALPGGFKMDLPWAPSQTSYTVLTGSAYHQGKDVNAIDFTLPKGTPVQATAGGYIRWAGWYDKESTWWCFGNSISIEHP